jgi:hypothetical protein
VFAVGGGGYGRYVPGAGAADGSGAGGIGDVDYGTIVNGVDGADDTGNGGGAQSSLATEVLGAQALSSSATEVHILMSTELLETCA